jgi:hypothetical protein
MDLGFSHAYPLGISLLPWDGRSLEQRLERSLTLMRAAGATSFRPHVPWSEIEPVLTGALCTVSEVTETQVERYANGGDGICWKAMDLAVAKMRAAGIEPFPCLGVAYYPQLPVVEHRRKLRRVNPGQVSWERYLGRLHLHVRAVVRRYCGQCHRWQLENELNGAGMHVLGGWRQGWAWFSHAFQDRVMQTIHQAVRAEDPTAETAHNFMVPLRTVPHVYTYRSHLKRWADMIDIVGIDPYPNFLRSEPICVAESFTRAVAEVRRVVPDKRLYILETGYPVRPAGRGFSEENQRSYYREALETALRLGVDGLFFYAFCSQEGAPGAEWCSGSPKNDIQDWWGLVRADGSLRPAYELLRERAGGSG